jgi:hypothetical protein
MNSQRRVYGHVHLRQGVEQGHLFVEYSFETSLGEDVVVHMGDSEFVEVDGVKSVGTETLLKLGITLEHVEETCFSHLERCRECGDTITLKLNHLGEPLFVCEICGTIAEHLCAEEALA